MYAPFLLSGLYQRKSPDRGYLRENQTHVQFEPSSTLLWVCPVSHQFIFLPNQATAISAGTKTIYNLAPVHVVSHGRHLEPVLVGMARHLFCALFPHAALFFLRFSVIVVVALSCQQA